MPRGMAAATITATTRGAGLSAPVALGKSWRPGEVAGRATQLQRIMVSMLEVAGYFKATRDSDPNDPKWCMPATCISLHGRHYHAKGGIHRSYRGPFHEAAFIYGTVTYSSFQFYGSGKELLPLGIAVGLHWSYLFETFHFCAEVQVFSVPQTLHSTKF